MLKDRILRLVLGNEELTYKLRIFERKLQFASKDYAIMLWNLGTTQ